MSGEGWSDRGREAGLFVTARWSARGEYRGPRRPDDGEAPAKLAEPFFCHGATDRSVLMLEIIIRHESSQLELHCLNLVLVGNAPDCGVVVIQTGGTCSRFILFEYLGLLNLYHWSSISEDKLFTIKKKKEIYNDPQKYFQIHKNKWGPT